VGVEGDDERQQVIDGIVVAGDRRGRELGFPTANVETLAELPPDGVYAGCLNRADGSRHLAAISVGSRSTYYGPHGERLVEAHVLDFDEELYGEQVTVLVGPKVRDQARFAGSDELIEQMRRDVEAVRAHGGR
jgi:FAD synthase